VQSRLCARPLPYPTIHSPGFIEIIRQITLFQNAIRPKKGLNSLNDIRFLFAFHRFLSYACFMFDPNAHLPRINKGMIYLGACLIAGIRLAREKCVNHRQIPTSDAINESVDLAHEIYNRVFRKVPERLMEK
jgi:hypothetical protein